VETSAGLAQAATVLYDGNLNTGTPDTQGFVYLALPFSGNEATQTYIDSLTVLDTMTQTSDYAGYFAQSDLYLPLDRLDGYSVNFRVQVNAETHFSHDRAGFSLLVTSSDKRGIELGFWENEVWAQEGGASRPFTHAEGAAFSTTAGLIDYGLSVLGDRYSLSANGTQVLAGSLRDYTLAAPPALPLNPYTTPNLIFVGDDTSAARARIKLRYAAVTHAPPFRVYLPIILKS
jgi:hypothetical protein